MTRALRHDRRGVVSVELALLAGLVILPLTLGAVDAGELLIARGRLDQCLHEALFFAWSAGGGVTGSSIVSAAQAGYGSGTAPAVNATITQYCIVPASGYPPTGTPPQPSNGVCPSASQTIQSYMLLTASASVTLPFTVPWVAKTVTLNVSGRARIA